jgi:hypothetical protein
MNCREAQQHLFADRGARDDTPRAALAAHVAHCAACARLESQLGAALENWRSETARVPVPDAEREWQILRRKIRGGVNVGDADATESSRPSRWLSWITLPLGAAAAAAIAFLVVQQSPAGLGHAPREARLARADFVEAPGAKASTMVYVDEKSGWLFVVASDETRQSGD